jgi:hypothetical protein
MTTQPFDRDLPSPIGDALQLRASSEASVVEGDGQLTPVQRRMRINTGLEQSIVEAATSHAYALILISGSAGGGKSLVINNIAAAHGDLFESVIEDATHADAPNQEQYERIVRHLGGLADGQPTFSGKPVLIAMNTGMVIRFFDQLRNAKGPAHGFVNLEAAVREKLGLVMPPNSEATAPPPGPVLVVNLDYRPTAGPDGSLFDRMLSALTPDRPDAVIDMRRCATCNVVSHCFVRTNAFIISSDSVRSTLNRTAEEIALERGRPLQPRALWDLIADLVTGGEPFGEEDPCDRIVETASSDGGAITVWRRLAFNGLFATPMVETGPPRRKRASRPVAYGRVGPAGKQIAELDISFKPTRDVHTVISESGIDPDSDSRRLVDAFAALLPKAAAIPTAATGLRDGLLSLEIDGVEAGRGLVRARWFLGDLRPADSETRFRAALADLITQRTETLEPIRIEVATAMRRAFGRLAAGRSFFRTEGYDARRRWAIDVNIDLEREDQYLPQPHDRVTRINPEGADLVGYSPLTLTFALPRQAELIVDLQLYRLLRKAARGTLPSSADLERFFQLRRAAEILGQVASQDPDRDLLLEDLEHGIRYEVFRKRSSLTARVAR